MLKEDAADRLASLLLPYCCREREDPDGPDHEAGWWFAAAPPAVVREALQIVGVRAGERPNDQPPEEWLMAQAEVREGVLAGFAAPADPASARMNVDAIIVPSSGAWGLASEIARLWPLQGHGSALDIAVVEGVSSVGSATRLWGMSGSDFLTWCLSSHDWLGARCCSFWWD
jgi:hypothetical protein